ncbi:MAG TPA: universal stress protein [Burkholderiales bacterium]|nr:universal stress protein [Burkholderiales bacterium]
MKILMAFDASENGLRSLLTAPELQWLPHERVYLLSVMPMPGGLFLGEGYVPGEILEEDRLRAQQILDDGVAQLRGRQFDAEGVLAAGEPVDEICKAAKHLSADLIFVRHPRRLSFAARWWKGWVGASLLDHAPCGILIGVSDKH